jgi:hypothetical protein
MALLLRTRPILLQDLVNDAGERPQLWFADRLGAPVARRHRVQQNLRYRPPINPKDLRRFTLAQALMMARKPHPPI